MELRNYQEAAITGVFNFWNTQKGKNPVIVMPTASGKTVVFTDLLRRLHDSYPDCRFLILAHTKELVTQAEKKLDAVYPGAKVSVFCSGLNRKETDGDIIIGSRDSVARNVPAMGHIDLVIIDEAHMISNARHEGRYRAIVSELRFTNPSINVLGFTATPYRMKGGYIYGSGEDLLFQDIAYQVKLKDLMNQKYISRVVARQVNNSGVADLSSVKTTAGDFNISQLSAVSSAYGVVSSALQDWHDNAYQKGRKATLFFCVTIEHALMLQNVMWDRHGIRMPMVTGKTPDDERNRLLAEFESDDCTFAGIINVGVLTTGYDCPRIDCIANLRATKSLGLWLQMVGRGFRLHPGKENTLLLDYGQCLDRFGPLDEAAPVTGRSNGSDEPKVKVCSHCETINKPGEIYCVECGQKFLNSSKDCPKCNFELPIRAIKCTDCGHSFLTHSIASSTAAAMSSDRRELVVNMGVRDVTAYKTKSKNGNEYIRVSFWIINRLKPVNLSLLFDLPGFMHTKAQTMWDRLTADHIPTPETVSEAEQIINYYKNTYGGIWKPVVTLKVDMGGKYPEIRHIYFENEVAA